MLQPNDILHFWFEETKPDQWFEKSPAFDELLRKRFLTVYQKACDGKLSSWMTTPQGTLALIILLDQFSRNLFRGLAAAFAQDAKVLKLAKAGIKQGFDQKLNSKEMQMFFYMPFMHSENLKDQEKGVELFQTLGDPRALEYMILHKNIIKKFGHFPHRNQALGRSSTKEETEFLQQPNSSF